MLKKAPVAAAVAAAALLTVGGIAYAAEEDSNGIDKGNQLGHGNVGDHCNNSLQGHDGPVILLDPAETEDCAVAGESYGQRVEQYKKNDD